jgi:membrane protease YdiL (CAAX protease family)
MKGSAIGETLSEIGLGPFPPFHRDVRFIAALVFGALFCLAWRVGFAEMPGEPAPFGLGIAFSLIIWQPFVEELLFRGIIQGLLLKNRFGAQNLAGISVANIATTTLFSAAHFVTQPPASALAVIIPSLIFGYFRERHRSAYPAIALHIAYNGFYFVTLSRFAPL